MPWRKLEPLHPLIRGMVVVTLIPPRTPPPERKKVRIWAKRLAKKIRRGEEYRRFCYANGLRPRNY